MKWELREKVPEVCVEKSGWEGNEHHSQFPATIKEGQNIRFPGYFNEIFGTNKSRARFLEGFSPQNISV